MPLNSALSRVCRACLQVSPGGTEMVSLFTSDLELTRKAHALLNLADVTIDPEDALPQQICQKCLDCLNDALTFKLKCQRSHFYLQHVIQTQSVIAPEDLYTNLQNSMFADMVQFTLESSNSLNVKIESDDFKGQLNPEDMKIEVLENIYDDVPEDPEELSHNDHLNVTLKDNSEPQDMKDRVNISLNIKPTVPGRRVNSQLTAAEIRLRDLILKTDRNRNKKMEKTIQNDLRQAVASNSSPVTEQNQFSPAINTQTAIKPIQTIQSNQAWEPILENWNAEKRQNIDPAEKVVKLKERLKNYLRMNPIYPKTTIKLPKTSNIPSHELDCKICGKHFSTNAALKIHTRRHMSPAVCEHCGKTFGGKSELLFHCMARHGHQRDWHCGHCGYEAMSRPMLIEHIRLHTGERPYTCETCGMAFRRKDILRKHSLRHFERKFKCEECDKGFCERGDLNAHVRERHHKLPPRRFHCTQPSCDVSYVKIQNMRNHLSGIHKIPRGQQGVLKKHSENPLTS